MNESTLARVNPDLQVRVWGMSQDGKPFFQQAHAVNIRPAGAVLTQLTCTLNPGDVIGVQYGTKKARCRVSSLQNTPDGKLRVEVQLLDGQPCPWVDELSTEQVANDPASLKSRRRYERHKIFFNMEMADERVQTPIRVRATDISANGCYVETMLPLDTGTILRVEFWIDAEKISTSGIIRAKDPGVGMGIEFTGLTPAIQKRFQTFLDSLDTGAGGFARPGNANAQGAS
jgi:hypothetical protein